MSIHEIPKGTNREYKSIEKLSTMNASSPWWEGGCSDNNIPGYYWQKMLLKQYTNSVFVVPRILNTVSRNNNYGRKLLCFLKAEIITIMEAQTTMTATSTTGYDVCSCPLCATRVLCFRSSHSSLSRHEFFIKISLSPPSLSLYRSHKRACTRADYTPQWVLIKKPHVEVVAAASVHLEVVWKQVHQWLPL